MGKELGPPREGSERSYSSRNGPLGKTEIAESWSSKRFPSYTCAGSEGAPKTPRLYTKKKIQAQKDEKKRKGEATSPKDDPNNQRCIINCREGKLEKVQWKVPEEKKR